MNNTIALFRVYSPFKPRLAVKVFAAGADAAIEAARVQFPILARFTNLKAFPA
jgi:hypothetical protein